MPPIPPNFWKLDRFGMAPIHLCAVLNKITDPVVQNKIATPPHPVLSNYMALKTDGAKRDAIARNIVNRYHDYPTDDVEPEISGPILDPTKLGTLDSWELCILYNSTPAFPYPPQSNTAPTISPIPKPNLPDNSREALLVQYLPLAYEMSGRFLQRYGTKFVDPGENYDSLATHKLSITIKNFNPTYGNSLVTFANKGFKGWMFTLLKKISTQKKRMAIATAQLNDATIYTDITGNETTSTSLDSPIEGKDGSSRTIHGSIADSKANDPSQSLEENEIQEIRNMHINQIMARLKKDEHRRIMELHFLKTPQNDIAKAVKLSPPTVSNTIKKFKKRLDKEMQAEFDSRSK